MSIISQIGVIILIIGTIFVLMRSNRQLEEAAREGEHFVDEWALKESLKEKQKKQIPVSKDSAPRAFRSKRPNFLGESETEQDAVSARDFELKTGQEITASGDFESESGQEIKYSQNPGNMSGAQTDPREKVITREVNLSLVEPADFQNPGRTIPVRKLPFTIGRAPDNDFVIDDLGVAKHHCRIIWKDQLIVMEDAGSRNKIYVNGNPQIRAVLKDNLIIGIGNKEFVVLRGDPTWRKQSAGR